jgi:hypothetical protein
MTPVNPQGVTRLEPQDSLKVARAQIGGWKEGVSPPYSTLAYGPTGPERQAMFDSQKERGMKGFLEARDGKSLPEPFGPKSKIKREDLASPSLGLLLLVMK